MGYKGFHHKDEIYFLPVTPSLCGTRPSNTHRRGSKTSRLWDHSTSYTTSKVVKGGSAHGTHSWGKEREQRMQTKIVAVRTQDHPRHGKQQMTVIAA